MSIKDIEKYKECALFTFNEDKPFYETDQLALFLEQLSKAYISVLRELKSIGFSYHLRPSSLSEMEDIALLLMPLIKENIKDFHRRWYEHEVVLLLKLDRINNLDHFLLKLGEIKKRTFRSDPDWAPYNGENSDRLRVSNINYNSPLKLGLYGYFIPLMLIVGICGGKFEVTSDGIKLETPGVVDTFIKLRKEFYTHPDFIDSDNRYDHRLEYQYIYKKAKEKSPDHPIAKELEKYI